MLMDEVGTIESALKVIHKDYKPSIAFFTVNKKISEKFYQLIGDKMENPNAGTFVTLDQEKFDFFMVA